MIPTQPFGSTGHQSTRAIFGAAALGRAADAAEAGPALELLLKHGVNHIDTAAGYGRSERRVGEWMPDHRDRFFLATKTNERTYDGAWGQIRKSLERLQTDRVDLLQLHNLVDEVEWETAMSPGGALEAVIEARAQGLTRFIGVTGHGVTVAAMHLRSLERFAFDSVLLPYNYTMMQNPSYAADFEALAKLSADRGIAFQTIKSLALAPWGDRKQTRPTWYEPLTEPADIEVAARYVFARPGFFLNTSADMSLVPALFEAAEQQQLAPSHSEMRALVERRSMTPMFV